MVARCYPVKVLPSLNSCSPGSAFPGVVRLVLRVKRSRISRRSAT